MMLRWRHSVLLGGLVSVACVVGFSLFDQWSPQARMTDQARSNSMVSELASAESATAVALPPVGAFAEIVRRPLFSPSRRPPVAAKPPPKKKAPVARKPVAKVRKPKVEPEPVFELIGVIHSAGESIVLLRSDDGGQVLKFKQGDRHRGWAVDSIQPYEVVLEKAGKKRRLTLFYGADARDAKAPAAKPRAPDPR